MAKYLGSADDSREQWLKLRLTGIGASEMPVLFGDGFKSPGQLWLEKRGQASPPDLSKNRRVQRGVLLQNKVARMWGQQMGFQERLVRSERLYQSEEYPFLLATLDYELTPALKEESSSEVSAWRGFWPWRRAALKEESDGKIPVEIKTADVRSGYPRGVAEGFAPASAWPQRVRIQVQQQLLVMGREMAYVVVLIDERELVWTRLRKEKGLQKEIVRRGHDFWERVKNGVPPG